MLLTRNVGHLMTRKVILDKGGLETPEGILDAVITNMIVCMICYTAAFAPPFAYTSSNRK
ncbi:hypothetical protein [Pseudomonas mediterranea]|uniref:hypothetical protein n=1 Tax=Pseudomonas mediterranea TaxID=183795 RepID=UPI001330F5F9|nr:hypothetical protein [Pseudomonas mediterranea]